MNIAKIRHEKILTRKEMGELLGVSAATIYNWETGRTSISARMRRKFFETFGIDPLPWRNNDE